MWGFFLVRQIMSVHRPHMINPHQDEALPYVYHLQQMANTHYYLLDNWLTHQASPRILVTGASSWMGRYILNILTYFLDFCEILAIDTLDTVDYLSLERYKNVHYQKLEQKFSDMQSIILSYHPNLIFHCDYVWTIQEKNISRIYEKNVWQIDVLCSAAKQAGVQKIILFSDSCIYGYSKEIVTESSKLQPILALGKSFAEAEKIAESYHQEHQLEIYHLRLAPLYGALIPHGIMLLARLVLEGFVLGPIENMPEKISILSGHDFALASLLLSLAPFLKNRIFQISTADLSMKELIDTIAQNMPYQKFLGFSTRLADIMKLGYQSSITIPEVWERRLSQYSEHTTRFLNQLRSEKHVPLFHRDTFEYFHSLTVFSKKLWNDSIEWMPTFSLDEILQSVQYALKHGWNMWERIPRPESEKLFSLFDDLTQITDSLEDYIPQEQEEAVFLKIPLFSFEIDRKSLWILFERIWSFIGIFFSTQKQMTASGNFYKIFPTISTSFLNIVRYENEKAKRLYPNDPQEQLYWLTNRIGGINHARMKKYIYIFILSEVLKMAYSKLEQYAPLIALLPEKQYGILIHTDIGDIGVILTVENNRLNTYFARNEVDLLSKSLHFDKKLSEFQKMNKLHIALGITLEKLLKDISSRTPLKNIRKGIGSDYIISNSLEYYNLVGNAVSQTQVSSYFFYDAQNRVLFGIEYKDRKWVMISNEYIAMIMNLYESFQDYKKIVHIIHESTQKNIVFLNIKTVKRILSGLISPSKIQKIVLKLLMHSRATTKKFLQK